ncbi:MAG: efflux transporter outer membrane subunit [Burkholderiales bacterium]|nr:efflux transporter outer membrane subunit [Burkholderiales bacterium]
MRKIIAHLGLTALSVLTLASCAIPPAPDHAALMQAALSQLQFPANWKFARSAGEFDAATLGFVLPPEILLLIREAQLNNPDLRLAALRVEQSHSAVKAAGAALYPTLGLGGQMGDATIPTSSLAMNGLALVSNWEIDIWGKTRSSQAASREMSMAAELEGLYARQSIAAAVVKAWLAAAEAQQQIQLVQAMVVLAEKQLALIQSAKKIGRNTQQDVVISQIALKNYRLQLLQSEQALSSARRGLEVLLGRYPAAEVAVGTALPRELQPIPVGLPSDLAERRPDLRAAENRFRAAFYQVEAAKKAKLPSISLMAGLGILDNSLLVLQKDLSNPIWGINSRLLAPIFTGGALDAQIEVKTAQQQESTVNYAKTVLNALAEIEGGLYAEQKLLERSNLLATLLANQQQLIDLQGVLIKVGKGDRYQLQQLQLNLASSQMTLLRLQNERLIQRVNLHLALGGIYPI